MKKGAFIFPGQGSQYAGMATPLLDNDAVSRLFDEANEILGYDLKDLCTEGTMQELTQTDVTQPAIFVTSIALFQLHKNRLPAAQFMAGHSLGEYTALTCAGAIDFPEALTLVKKRATLMKKAAEQGQGTMLAVQDLQGEVLGNICGKISR